MDCFSSVRGPESSPKWDFESFFRRLARDLTATSLVLHKLFLEYCKLCFEESDRIIHGESQKAIVLFVRVLV